MPWWSWRPGPAGGGDPDDGRSGITVEEATVRVGPPAQRQPEDDVLASERAPIGDMGTTVEPVTLGRVCDALDLLDVRYLADGDGNLLAMWERHAVLVTLEGPEDEILVMRARPHATVPPDWADRAYRVVNEWNHTRRFCKAYIGDPTERGQLPIYAELQVPLGAGTHDALLIEMLDCGAAVATSFVDWLHDEGALL
ncbi:YbjN domain-containing protein [Micromonospora sp. NPDC050686]|uniref:YbjN domain-containing protein n=1 Tax=Micromonospora sp. NPDC050686 TaxID=3154631 RepID=UPI0033D99025